MQLRRLSDGSLVSLDRVASRLYQVSGLDPEAGRVLRIDELVRELDLVGEIPPDLLADIEEHARLEVAAGRGALVWEGFDE